MASLEARSPDQGSSFLDFAPATPRVVALPLLLADTLVTVQTRNTLYRLVVEDGSEGRVSITGGPLFQQSTAAAVIGSADDDGRTKMGWIVEGLRLELMTEAGPVITSPVESVDVDVDAASVTGEETD